MLSEDKLIAWFVIFDWHTDDDGVTMTIPLEVQERWRELGWIKNVHPEDWRGVQSIELSTKGRMVIDLHSTDYGLNPIPQESET